MKNFFKTLIDKIRRYNRQKDLEQFNMGEFPDRVILGYTLVRTCYACPEQYDVFTRRNKLVGYLRLRHGRFTVQYPDVYGPIILETNPKGDGMFESDEREHFLTMAILAIKEM